MQKRNKKRVNPNICAHGHNPITFCDNKFVLLASMIDQSHVVETFLAQRCS